MQNSQLPLKWYKPFAADDSAKVEIPVTTADPTRASQSAGFPPLTMQPPESGGVPPQGEDFNGAMNQVARIVWWKDLAGGALPFDATWAGNAAIGGYPQGAKVAAADLQGEWISTADNNTNDPDTVGTGWVPGSAYGATALTGLTNANVTLTPAQAAKSVVTLAGLLTGNIQIIIPTWRSEWLFINNTTGAFAVTVKTAAGSGVVLGTGGAAHILYGDGTNVRDGTVTWVRTYGTTAYQPNAVAQFVNSDNTRSTNLYTQAAAGATATSVLERRNGSNTPIAQIVLKDGSVEITDTSPTTSNSMTLKMVGSSAGLRFDNISSSTGSNNIAFGWTSTSVLGLRIDGSNVGTLTPSDRRLKLNIKPIEHGSALVAALAVYSFEYDQSKSPIGFRPGRRYGWIAQEVESEAPAVVHEWTIDTERPDETTFKELDDAQMVPILWNAVRELISRIDALEASARPADMQ